jgi:hypothetical protein
MDLIRSLSAVAVFLRSRHRMAAVENEQPTAFEEIIQIHLRDVDRTLIRENLSLTPAQRLQKLEEFVEFLQSAKNPRQWETTAEE